MTSILANGGGIFAGIKLRCESPLPPIAAQRPGPQSNYHPEAYAAPLRRLIAQQRARDGRWTWH